MQYPNGNATCAAAAWAAIAARTAAASRATVAERICEPRGAARKRIRGLPVLPRASMTSGA